MYRFLLSSLLMYSTLFVAFGIRPYLAHGQEMENSAPSGTKPSPVPVGFTPTEDYQQKAMRGWQILIDPELSTQGILLHDTLELLDSHLYQIERVIPDAALKKIKTVKIWVHLNHPQHECLVYHPNEVWLTNHGMNPDKAGAVEVSNAKRFLRWSTKQPWFVLHELAHAYHHQFLEGGFTNKRLRHAYTEAMKSGRYKRVLHISGHDDKAYAATNVQEYFAEASEAYFGTNDFYPFVRAELKQHDERLFDLIRQYWEMGSGEN